MSYKSKKFLMKNSVKVFTSTWNTANISTGSTASNQIKIPLAPLTVINATIDWGDGTSNLITSYNQAQLTHTYASSGVYTIKIIGSFDGAFYFNNTGDKLKLTGISNFGDIVLSATQTSAFYGCANLTSLPDDCVAQMNLVTSANSMFHQTGLTSLPSGLTLNNLINANNMFNQTYLTALPSGMLLSSLSSGVTMFYLTSLTSLPSGMTLSNLTNGNSMFQQTGLTSLPSVMLLSNLTNGDSMFYLTSLTSLPSGMTLGNLTTGKNMFRQTPLASLPSSMTLGNLTNGDGMFRQTPLASLPSSMTLGNLTNGNDMFRLTSLTSLPSGMLLSSLTIGNNMFTSVTINKTRYSQLLIDINANNTNTGVVFNGGNSKYDTSGQTARNSLTSRSPSWTITDGGFEP